MLPCDVVMWPAVLVDLGRSGSIREVHGRPLTKLVQAPPSMPCPPKMVIASRRAPRFAPSICLSRARLLLQAQYPALHLAGGGHRQRLDEFHLLGVLLGRQLVLHVCLQLRHQLGVELLPGSLSLRSCRHDTSSNAHIACRTLWLAGTHDLSIPLLSAEVLCRSISGARLRTLDTGRMSAVERPEEFANFVHEFIQKS